MEEVEKEEGLASVVRMLGLPALGSSIQSHFSLGLCLQGRTYSEEEVTPGEVATEAESKGSREFNNILSRSEASCGHPVPPPATSCNWLRLKVQFCVCREWVSPPFGGHEDGQTITKARTVVKVPSQRARGTGHTAVWPGLGTGLTSQPIWESQTWTAETSLERSA